MKYEMSFFHSSLITHHPSFTRIRQSLRQSLRNQRRALTSRQRRVYAKSLTRRLSKDPLFIRSRRIAFYLPDDGEMDLSPLLQKAWQRRKSCYLPVLQAQRSRLWFLLYQRKGKLRLNRFKIPEPARRSPPRLPWSLDLVLMPLVAFDQQGNRLGRGGGFYDRTFAYLQRHPCRRQPRLLGVGYDFQCLETGVLPVAAWDVPLWGVITEKRLYRFV